MDYLVKIEKKPKEDLAWNIPEKKQGAVNIIGGNSQNFKTEIKVTEYFGQKYPVETLNLILPNALEKQLPPLPNFCFLKSTDSGSFADTEELKAALTSADYNLIIGDLSKNSVTKKAVASACESSEKPLLITRDAIDLIIDEALEKLLMNDKIIFLTSMLQIQKLFRAIYYPKVITLSQSLIQVTEALHKFTLSYPVKIITFHGDQIIIVENGNIRTIPLVKTKYSPITLWNGELAADIVAFNLYNSNQFMDATVNAIFS